MKGNSLDLYTLFSPSAGRQGFDINVPPSHLKAVGILCDVGNVVEASFLILLHEVSRHDVRCIVYIHTNLDSALLRTEARVRDALPPPFRRLHLISLSLITVHDPSFRLGILCHDAGFHGDRMFSCEIICFSVMINGELRLPRVRFI